MIQKQSDDPDVEAAAQHTLQIVREALAGLPEAKMFDYGGHNLAVGEYGVCIRCTTPIAEAQQAQHALLEAAAVAQDEVVKEHLALAGELMRLEAAAAQIRAEFHNGHGSEKILNELLAFIYNRAIHDSYDHSHSQGV